MVERNRKKKNKLRGNRSFGKGNTKNNRGGGSRGGRGRAGSKKHNKLKYLHEVGALRKLKPKRKAVSLNLKDINKIVEKILKIGSGEKKEGLIVFDGKKQGVEKILSIGELNKKVVFKNIIASKRATAKIENAGGKIELQIQNKPGKEEEK